MIKISDYKNLIKTVAVTDFKLKYEGSVLGYFWSLAKPLLMFSVLLFVFTRVFKIGGEIPNYPVYLLSGIVLWSFFTEATQTLMGSIAGKAHVIRKVYFPRIILPIANSFTAVLVLMANLVIVVIFMIFYKIAPTWSMVWLPLLFLELYILVLGVGLLLSALYVRFRDIAHIWDVVLQAMFYGTPILYSPERMPELARKIQMLNPMAQIIQDFRSLVISPATLTASEILPTHFVWIPYALPIITLIVGYFVFNKMAARFAEDV
jgi:ABC-2 type transport system permease protein